MKLMHRDNVTQMQLSSLLSTAATLNGILTSMLAFDAGEREGGKLDGGVRSSVENSILGVCNRIDEIISDSPRWTLEKQNALEDSLLATHKSIQRTNEIACAPHSRFHPRLASLPDGMWIAFLGNVDDLENALVGCGDSPQAAIKSFDMLFNGEIPAHLLHWITKPIKNDEQQTLDTNATGTVSDDETTGKDSAGNGGISGADNQGGASPTGTDTDDD